MGMGIVGSALVGALGGWGEALAKLGEMEWKEEALAKREAYLSKNRMAERESDIRAKEASDSRERERLGLVAREVDASLPSGKPAWESNTKQGDAIDAGDVSEVKLSEAEKSRLRVEGYTKRGERGLVKDEMGRMSEERRFELDENRARAAERETARREQRDEELARHNKREEEIAARRVEAAISRSAGGEKLTAKEKDMFRLAEVKFGYDKSKDPSDPENKKALASAAMVIWAERDNEYTTTRKEEYDDKGNRIVRTERTKSSGGSSTGKPWEKLRGSR